MKKHWKTVAATVSLCCAMSVPAWADTTTSIYYNGTLLNTAEPVVNINGRTLLAFRDLFNCLDAQVEWSDQYRMATATYGKTTVNLFPDTGAVQVNGTPQQLAVGPQIIDDRVYIPLRFVSQALGATVDYTKDPATDHGTITINSIDDVKNYAVTEGNLTTILREIPPTEEKNAAYDYYMDIHGNLVELLATENGLTVNVIDINKGEVSSTDYSTRGVYPAIYAIDRVNDTYIARVNQTTGNTYVGIGTPADGVQRAYYETDNGTLYLYYSYATEQSIMLDAQTNQASGLLSSSTSGYVMDFSDRSTRFNSGGYATTADGQYHGFLMDNYLTIVKDNLNLEYDGRIDTGLSKTQLFSYNNYFVVTAISDGTSPELYAGVYHTDGSIRHSLHNISKLSRATDGDPFYGYSSLRITAQIQDGNKLYFLLNNGWDRYCVVYNIATDTSNVEKLSIKDKYYDSFIHTESGVKLFASDQDYYYVRDCE